MRRDKSVTPFAKWPRGRVSTAALVLTGIASCGPRAERESSVQSPLVSGITDDTLRAAAACPDCAVIARSTVTLPLTGKTFTDLKLVSATGALPHAAAVDIDGKVVDSRALIAAEGAAKITRQGKLRDDAYSRSSGSSSELVPIEIWADFGDQHAPREQILSNSTLRAANRAQTASRLHATTSKVTAWLDARGCRTYDRGLESPVITADVPASALAALGRLDGVAIVHLRYPDRLAGFAWFDTVRGPAAQATVSSAAGLAFCNGEGGQPSVYTYLNVAPWQIFDATAQSTVHAKWTTELVSATTSFRMAPDALPYIAGWIATPSDRYTA